MCRGHSTRVFVLVFVGLCAVLSFGQRAFAGPMDMVIVLDRSGSMRGYGDRPATDPNGLSIPAAAFILEQLSLMGEDNHAAVVAFNDTARILGQRVADPKSALTGNIPGLVEMLQAGSRKGGYAFTENAPDEPKVFQTLLRDQMKEGGQTELGLALKMANRILEHSGRQRRKVIVLISDGFPEIDYRNPKRLDQLGEFAGIDLINRFRKGRYSKADIRNLNRKYGENILKTTARQLAENGISVFPVAFKSNEKAGQPFVDYLQKLREVTDGDRDIIQATARNLIAALIGRIPTGQGHILLYNLSKKKEFVSAGVVLKKKKQSFVIPKFARQVRFFFAFPSRRSEQRIRIRLFRDGKLVGNSTHPNPVNVIYSEQMLRNKTVAYQSFRITSGDVSGKWRVELEDTSRAQAEHLPQTDLLIDIRAQLDLEVSTFPVAADLRTKEPVEFRFTLFGTANDAPYVLPIHHVDAFMLGRSPQEISHFSDKIRAVKYEKTAVASWSRFEQPGLYLLKGWVHFHPLNLPTLELKTYFEKRYRVGPAVPVTAWFSLRGAKERIAGGRLQLPELGNELAFEFRDLKVRTSSLGNISGLTLVCEPLTHTKLGVPLSRAWVSIRPEKILRLSAKAPAAIHLKVQFPEVVPEALPDGVYQAELSLENGLEELDSLQLFVPIRIPRLIQDKKSADRLYEGAQDNPAITIEKVIYYPGTTPHRFIIPLWSSSNHDVEVQVYFAMAQGLRYSGSQEEDNAQPRNNSVIFSAAKGPFRVPDKNTKNPGKIVAQVVLEDASLNGQSFVDTLRLTAERHRPKAVRLIAHVRFIPRTYLLAGGGLLFILAALLFLWAAGWRKKRSLFRGYRYQGEDQQVDLRYGQRRLGRFSRNVAPAGSRQPPAIVFIPGTRAQCSLLPAGRSDEEEFNWQAIESGGEQEVGENDTIQIQHAGKAFRAVIEKLPDTYDPDFIYGIEKSSLGSGKKGQIYFVLGGLILAVAAYIIFQPYGILRLLNL